MESNTYDCKCNKAFKIYEYLYIENCSCRKHVLYKLVITCEDETLNTTESSPNKKVAV